MHRMALRGAASLLGVAVLLVAPAAAQDAEAREDREHCVCLDREHAGAPMASVFISPNRARIGVMLGEAAEVDGTTGVRVEEVIGDGPAEAAGIQPGDVITAMDGEPLGNEPAEAITRAMRDTDPGETVTLTYYRDGQRHTTEVVTDQMSGFGFIHAGDGFDVRMAPRMMELDRIRGRTGDLNVVAPQALMRRLSPAGLGLVEVNPELGAYFGTDRGVLVSEVGDDSALGLQPGDVILAIDGRDVRDPAHVRAILDSYRPDEEVTLTIVRQDRRMEVTGATG